MSQNKEVPFGKLNDSRSHNDKASHYNKINMENAMIGAKSTGQSSFVNYGQ
jgi:hypothetical protein